MLYEMRLVGLAMDPFSNSPIVILKDRNVKDTGAEGEAASSGLLSAGGTLGDEDKSPEELAKEERILPIWIGEAEAQAIATELLGLSVPRPMTHDLLKSAIQALGGKVNRVIVTDLKENTFYAVIEVEVENNDTLTLDSRPSDALALALRFGADILVDAQVLEKTYKSETATPRLDESIDDEFDENKWEEMVEKLSAQSVKKYKQ